MLLLLAVAVLAIAVWAGQKLRRRDDLQTRLVTVAARWLPADRQEWADALIAESAAVRGDAARWAYVAAAVVVVVLSAAAVVAVPTLAPFVITLAVLLALYVAARAGRSTARASTVAQRTVTFMALAGITAIVAVLCAVATVHPSATADHAHILSTLLAAALTGYLGGAVHRPAAHAGLIRYTATAGALCLIGVTAFSAATRSGLAGVGPMLSPATIGVCLIVATGVAVATGSTAAGRRAGLLTATLAAPLQLAIATISLLTVHHWSLTDTYDQAAYPRSGYPDVASYMISDALSGHIIASILIGPLTLGVIASAAAPVAARLGRPRHR